MAKNESLTNVSLSPQKSLALQRVFDEVPQDEIISALLESGDDRAVQLAERLSDSKYDTTYLAKHCLEVKLLPKDVWNILIDSRKLEARLKLSQALTGIVAAVAEAAVPRIADCTKCRGKGTLKPKKGETDGAECEKCNGFGRIIREPDKDSQKMALEMGELINQKVPLIAQQFNSFGKTGTEVAGVPNMADWSRKTDPTFESRQPVIEAEIIKEDTNVSQ